MTRAESSYASIITAGTGLFLIIISLLAYIANNHLNTTVELTKTNARLDEAEKLRLEMTKDIEAINKRIENMGDKKAL